MYIYIYEIIQNENTATQIETAQLRIVELESKEYTHTHIHMQVVHELKQELHRVQCQAKHDSIAATAAAAAAAAVASTVATTHTHAAVAAVHDKFAATVEEFGYLFWGGRGGVDGSGLGRQ